MPLSLSRVALQTLVTRPRVQTTHVKLQVTLVSYGMYSIIDNRVAYSLALLENVGTHGNVRTFTRLTTTIYNSNIIVNKFVNSWISRP